MGFTVARLQYLSFTNFCSTGGAAPGECYYYQNGYKHVGIILHLSCVLRKLLFSRLFTWACRII
jgi:hypothetical protein